MAKPDRELQHVDGFKEAARGLGCDEPEERVRGAVRMVAKAAYVKPVLSQNPKRTPQKS